MVAVFRFALPILVFAATAASPALAQQRIQIGDLVQRLERLESEVIRLRVAPGDSGADAVRLDQIEAELRRLTGMVERLDIDRDRRMGETQARLDGFETRLRALEQAPPPVAAAPPRGTSYGQPLPEGPTLSLPAPAPVLSAPAYSAPPGLPPVAVEPIDRQVTLSPPVQVIPQPVPETILPAPVAVQPAGAGAEQLYQDGLRLLNEGSFDQAGAQFEELIATYPSDPRAGQAQFWLGDMHFKLGRFEQAASAFLDSFRNWPDGAKAPDSLLKLGMTLATIGKIEEACVSFSQVPARYPSASPNLLRRAEIERQRTGCAG